MNLDREFMYIAKGGKLMENKWVYNKKIKKGSYILKDITGNAVRNLFEVCELEEGVTLKDIFLLINTELLIFDSIIGNWCSEIVTEGLTQQPQVPYTGQYDKDEIEYLELYWDFWADQGSKDGPSFYGYARPDFHGVGYELQDNTYFDWIDKDTGQPAIEWPKGNRIPWSLSFQASNKLINLPVKLQTQVSVYNDNLDDKTNWHNIMHTYKGATFSLGSILYGILWELSFHGGPSSREKAGAELNEIVKEVKDGTAKLTPYNPNDLKKE